MINYLEYDAKSGYVIIHSPNKNNLVQIMIDRIRQLCSPKFGDHVDTCCYYGNVPVNVSYFDKNVETNIDDDDYIDAIYLSKIPFIYKNLVLYYSHQAKKFYLYKRVNNDHFEKEDVRKIVLNNQVFPIALSNEMRFTLIYIKVFRLRSERFDQNIGTEDQLREEFKMVLAAIIHEMVMYNISSNL